MNLSVLFSTKLKIRGIKTSETTKAKDDKKIKEKRKRSVTFLSEKKYWRG